MSEMRVYYAKCGRLQDARMVFVRSLTKTEAIVIVIVIGCDSSHCDRLFFAWCPLTPLQAQLANMMDPFPLVVSHIFIPIPHMHQIRMGCASYLGHSSTRALPIDLDGRGRIRNRTSPS